MNEEPLGDGSLQITYTSPEEMGIELEPGETDMALLTCRGKDHDVTAAQLREIAAAAIRVAEAMEKNA